MVAHLSEALKTRILRFSRTTSPSQISAMLGVSRATVYRVLARKDNGKTTSEDLKRRIPGVIRRLRRSKGRKRVSAREIADIFPGVSVRSVSRVVQQLGLDLTRIRKRAKNEALNDDGLKRLSWFACRMGWG